MESRKEFVRRILKALIKLRAVRSFLTNFLRLSIKLRAVRSFLGES